MYKLIFLSMFLATALAQKQPRFIDPNTYLQNEVNQLVVVAKNYGYTDIDKYVPGTLKIDGTDYHLYKSGQLAGIVIGSMLGGGVVGALIVFLVYRRITRNKY